MTKHRVRGFVVLAFVYVSAIAVGIGCYTALPYAWWVKLLLADIAATVWTFIFSIIFKNASVYDPYWSVQPLVVLFALAIGKPIHLPMVLILFAVGFWGVRLTANWAYTFHGLSFQDWRYTMLQETTGGFYPVINFVGIHMVPTLVVYGCVLPAAAVILFAPGFVPWCLLFFACSVAAALMQMIADWQMQRFRKQKSGGFIRVGLWKYSRHPNYFGEILMWWGVALFACTLFGFKWYWLIGATANTCLFFFVSIPMAERRQSKKPGFAEYRLQTRVLLPIKL